MDWTRGRTIGRGSSAAVSIATAHGSGEVFAVKSAKLSKSEFLQRERKILSSLKSPKIIAYRGFNVSSENGELIYNLCLEFAAGGSLSDHISRRGGRLSQAEIRAYTRQILIGLDYLHSEGIVHCDVKGQNVLVTGEGLKIADLGCARFSDDMAAGDWVPVAGTPAYMAPEVARGEQQGFAADVWALGCTVIEMATGRAPWATDVFDPVSVLYRVGFSDEVPEIPSFVSKEGEDFLGKCLKRDPLERWSVSELLNHPFLEGPEPQSDCEFDLDSPRCVLDLDNGFLDSEKDPNPVRESVMDSPGERIRRLSEGSTMSFWGMNDWALDDDWVTVRNNWAQEEQEMITFGPLSNGLAVCEPTNLKWEVKLWTIDGVDLASSTKFISSIENCKLRRRNSSDRGSDWGSRRSSDYRVWKISSLMSFKCTRDLLFDSLNFEMDLWFFMRCPPSFFMYIQNTNLAHYNSSKPFEISSD